MGVSTNTVNPNASRARGIVGTGGCGGIGGGTSTGGRKANTGRNSQSSAGTIGAAAGGASKMNVDGPEGVREGIESPMDARSDKTPVLLKSLNIMHWRQGLNPWDNKHWR